MSNIIELNIAEIDTVVGGVNAQQAALIQQMSLTSRPTATMVLEPNRTLAASSFSAGSYDKSALLARFEALR